MSEDQQRSAPTSRGGARRAARPRLVRVVAAAAVAACVALTASLEARRLEHRAVAVQDAIGQSRPAGDVLRREGSAQEVFEWIRSFEQQAPAGRGELRLEVVARDEGGPRLIAEVRDGEAIRREEER